MSGKSIESFCSTILSNLGNAFGGRSITLESNRLSKLEFLPPLRQGSYQAIGVISYAGTTNITFHQAEDKMGTESLKSFQNSFVKAYEITS